MIAVFLASIRVRSSHGPGHMFLTFQLAIRRTDTFLTFIFVMLGAVLHHDLAMILSSKHPMKQVDRGGTPP